MKKNIYLITVLLIAVLLVGCNKQKTNENNNIVDIVDKVERDGLTCAEALEEFYEDEDNVYYYSCMKSSNVIVKYTDGTEETVKEALKKGKIKISDLDRYGINYYREAKVL